MSGWARCRLSLAASWSSWHASSPRRRASLHAEETLASQFAEFKQKHGRVYGSAAEEAFRLSVFRENLFLARLHRRRQTHTRPSASRPFSDLTREEFRSRYHKRRGATLRRRRSARGVPVNVEVVGGAPGSGLACERRRDSRQGPGPMRFVLGLLRHWQR
ncbi:hypothetical protein TcBrA4_0068210 [Trypanosoma cruzi]|nr:hypothetical protein TcBrA4_0068210 [Trypanosoma cruzi]